jgi:microcystin degradation protein MlrC
VRIAIGGISHETSSFAVKPTTLKDFEEGFGLFRGEEILQRFTGANICTGGFIDGAKKHGFEAVPILWGFAYPSGTIIREDYETLKREFVDRLRSADQQSRLDGALLDLHGAMVVDGIDDADADVIEAVRSVLGDRPIMVTFDLHGNHTPRRVAAATAICGFDTYPHVDMAERGREAADLIVRTIRGEIRPVMAIKQVPLIWSTPTQVTAHPPMNDVIARVHELETRPGMLSMTIATGFAWADVPDIGCSIIAVANGDQSVAEKVADEMATWVWENRERWYQAPTSVRDALAAGEKLGKYPIILADHADNTGGGSPGDSTEVLQTFLDMKLQDSLILYIVDPEVAHAAHKAGVGARLKTPVGGKSSPLQGEPVMMDAEVMSISNGDFTYDGPMYAGLTGNMGTSAWIREAGVSVVVVCAHEQPLGPAFAKTLGIDCAKMKYISVKSAAHFRASFEKIAGSIHNVDAQGIHTHEFAKLPFQRRTRKMFPIEIQPRSIRARL